MSLPEKNPHTSIMGCPVSDEAWAKGKEFAENTYDMAEYVFWRWVPGALAKAARDRAHAFAVGYDRAIEEHDYGT